MSTVLESLNQGLHQLMEGDDRVVVLGEDVLDPYGGAFKVTRGLSTRFPTRVLTTPISEGAIVGLGCGLALRGFRPVVEIMFGDFLMLAADQLVNSASKFGWMYNDRVTVPLVVRTPVGGRRGDGPTHSQSLEKHFLGVPGLSVVAPHVLGSPGALLAQAVRLDAPVLFIESKACYSRPVVDAVDGMTTDVMTGEESSFPTTYLRHDRPAVDGVLWCYGGMVPLGLDAVRHLRDVEGLYVDLVVVSQLSPVPLAHIRKIVAARRADLFVYAEEATAAFGWAAEVIACIEAHVDRPIRHERVGAVPTPIPSSRELEQRVLPQVADIVARVLECF